MHNANIILLKSVEIIPPRKNVHIYSILTAFNTKNVLWITEKWFIVCYGSITQQIIQGIPYYNLS